MKKKQDDQIITYNNQIKQLTEERNRINRRIVDLKHRVESIKQLRWLEEGLPTKKMKNEK